MAIKEYPSGMIPSVSGQSGKYLTTNGSNLSWGTVSAGGMTLLASGSVGTGTSVSLTSISSDYNQLIFIAEDLDATGSAILNMRINNNSTASSYRITTFAPSGAQSLSDTIRFYSGNDDIDTTNNPRNILYINFPNYASTTSYKVGQFLWAPTAGIAGYAFQGNFMHTETPTSAINRLDLRLGNLSQNFTGGTYKLYGVK